MRPRDAAAFDPVHPLAAAQALYTFATTPDRLSLLEVARAVQYAPEVEREFPRVLES